MDPVVSESVEVVSGESEDCGPCCACHSLKIVVSGVSGFACLAHKLLGVAVYIGDWCMEPNATPVMVILFVVVSVVLVVVGVGDTG